MSLGKRHKYVVFLQEKKNNGEIYHTLKIRNYKKFDLPRIYKLTKLGLFNVCSNISVSRHTINHPNSLDFISSVKLRSDQMLAKFHCSPKFILFYKCLAN